MMFLLCLFSHHISYKFRLVLLPRDPPNVLELVVSGRHGYAPCMQLLPQYVLMVIKFYTVNKTAVALR